MWRIRNSTSYKAGKTWGRDRAGVHEWIVAVKATFDIGRDGVLSLAEEQLDPLLAPEYHTESGLSSLRYDADLVSMKPTTDVVVNGTAYAPGGKPSTDFVVAMKVGPVRKVLRVRGDRRWGIGPFGSVPSSPEYVTRVPIVYERAYGGYDHVDPDPARQRLDPRNPVGVGVVAEPGRRIGQPVPNFEYPNGDLEKNGPAGFGPIDCFWSPRRELQGTYDKAWERNRMPLLPEDWDPRSLLCSPVDQRPDTHLRGGELVELTNLTPEGKLSFLLPKIHLAFSTHIDGRIEEHRARLSTVILEPDHPRVVMVWLSSLTVRGNYEYLDATFINEKEFVT